MHESPLEVLYDLSSMALVVDDPANYTGVQRVVHEVAAGLAHDPRVRLSLYGNTCFAAAEAFAASDPRLADCPFVRGRWERRGAQIANWLNSPGAARRPERRTLAARGSRWLRRHGAAFCRSCDGRISRRQIAKQHIYHSPVFAFPPDVSNPGSKLRRFLTIYDLSPVKMPEHTIEPILAEFHAMVNGIRPQQDFFLCISQSTKNDWCKHTGSDPAHCFVTPLAAAPHFAPCGDEKHIAAVRVRYQIPPEARYFMSLSTLEPRKNLVTVIRAFADLLHQTSQSDLYLVLAGRPGWKSRAILEAAGADAMVRARILFTGYAPEADLAPLLSDALAFVYLSFYEGFGLPPLEAMQCGTPVIVSSVSSLPEVVGDAGILLEPSNRDGLAAAMLRLAADSEQRQTLRAQSLQRAREFTWERCVDATVSAYQRALAIA